MVKLVMIVVAVLMMLVMIYSEGDGVGDWEEYRDDDCHDDTGDDM